MKQDLIAMATNLMRRGIKEDIQLANYKSHPAIKMPLSN